VIRGVIGFQGLLMSDDVSMNALAGIDRRADPSIITAGCDIGVHCNGDLGQMRESRVKHPNCPARRWNAPAGRWRRVGRRKPSIGLRRGLNWTR